jgi:hypothetical protein
VTSKEQTHGLTNWAIPRGSFFLFFFASTRGIQQGDQLSSLLFAFVVEALSQLNSKAVDGGYLTGFTANMADNDLLKISHLLFVDDTLCLCNAKPNHICYFFFLMHVVMFWSSVYLKINLSKSEIVPVGEVIHLEELVDILGCKMSSFPLKYLGLPLGARYTTKAIWDDIL